MPFDFIWPRRSQADPDPAPLEVRLPMVQSETHNGREVLKIMGSVVAPIGAVDGKYIGATGYVDTPEEASRINGEDGSNGDSGWTPVLSPEQDGVRALLKVSDWQNGTGTKPQTGMYLAIGGYTTIKANAFNFNLNKRLDNYNIRTAANGTFSLTFNTPFPAPPRVIPAAIGVVSGSANRAVVTSITTTGCTIRTERTRSSLLALGTIVDVVGGIDVDVIAVEA